MSRIGNKPAGSARPRAPRIFWNPAAEPPCPVHEGPAESGALEVAVRAALAKYPEAHSVVLVIQETAIPDFSAARNALRALSRAATVAKVAGKELRFAGIPRGFRAILKTLLPPDSEPESAQESED